MKRYADLFQFIFWIPVPVWLWTHGGRYVFNLTKNKAMEAGGASVEVLEQDLLEKGR